MNNEVRNKIIKHFTKKEENVCTGRIHSIVDYNTVYGNFNKIYTYTYNGKKYIFDVTALCFLCNNEIELNSDMVVIMDIDRPIIFEIKKMTTTNLSEIGEDFRFANENEITIYKKIIS